MSTQCAREGAGVHCGLTMKTLPDRVPVLPVENYPDPIPEENATRLSPIQNHCMLDIGYDRLWYDSVLWSCRPVSSHRLGGGRESAQSPNIKGIILGTPLSLTGG